MSVFQGARVFKAIIWKEALLDSRDPVIIVFQLLFSLGAGVVVGLASRTSIWRPEALIEAGVPLTLLFVSLFTSYSSFYREAEKGGPLEALRLSPASPSIVFLAKTAYSLSSITASMLVFLFAAGVLTSQTDLLSRLAVWIVAASPYMAAVSSLAGVMMVYSRAGVLGAPALAIGLSAPYLYTASGILTYILSGGSVGIVGGAQMLLPTVALTLVVLSFIDEIYR